MGCAVTSGLDLICDEKKGASGVQNFMYAYNREDYVVSYDGDGLITGFTAVSVGKQFYKFKYPKNLSSAGYEGQGGEGGNKSFKTNVKAQLVAQSQSSLNVINELVHVDDIVIVVPKKNEFIHVYGDRYGLEVEAEFLQDSGATGTDNNLHQLTFSGESNNIYPEFKDTDYITSIATLEGLLTASV